MSILGGSQQKIKIIDVSRVLPDITKLSDIELEKWGQKRFPQTIIQYFNYVKTSLNEKEYSSVKDNESLTILLRYVLYIPHIIPLILVKGKSELNVQSIYTRVPIVKKAYTQLFKQIRIPDEESVNIIGLISILPIDNDKIFKKISKYKIFLFEKSLSIDEISRKLYIIINIAKYMYIYNPEINIKLPNENDEYIADPSFSNQKNTLKIDIFNKREIEAMKFLFKESDYVKDYYSFENLGINKRLLLIILNTGYESQEVLQYFDKIEIDKITAKKQQEVEILKEQRINISKQYIIICEVLFGEKIVYDILKKLTKGSFVNLPGGKLAKPTMLNRIVDPQDFLKTLTKEQKDLVLIEYNRRISYKKQFIENKCEHIKIYNSIMERKTVETVRKSFVKLKDFLGEIVNGFYNCKLCDFPILCSHLHDRIESSEILNEPLSKTNDRMLEYIVKTQYKDITEMFCKYCGTVLLPDAPANLFAKKPRINRELEIDIDVRNYAWYVLHVYLTNTIEIYGNNQRIVSYLLDTLMNVLSSLEPLIDSNEIKIRIVIYSAALILITILKFKISIINISPEIGLSKAAEKVFQFMFTVWTSLFKKSKSGGQLNISIVKLKNEFMKAYKIITSYEDQISIPVSNLEEYLTKFIVNIHPLYAFARKIHRTYISKIDISKELSPKMLKNEFEAIMGISIPDIVKKIKSLGKDNKYKMFFNYGMITTNENLDFFYRQPQLNLFSSIFEIKDSKKIIDEYIKGNTSKKDLATYALLRQYIVLTRNEKELEEYRTLLAKVNEIEPKPSRVPLIETSMILSNEGKIRKINVAQVTKVYDENGIKHKWNIFIYDKNEYKMSEIPTNRLIAVPTNYRCGICGILKTEWRKLSIEKTINSIDYKYMMFMFYQYYRIRCPLRNNHSFVNDVCEKCKISISTIENALSSKSNEETISYYDKYKSVFADDKKEARKSKSHYIIVKEKQKKNLGSDYDYTIIVNTARSLSCDINLIESIGKTEGRKYKDILDKIDIPDTNIAHILSAISELMLIYRIYWKYNISNNAGFKIDNFKNDISLLLDEPNKNFDRIHKFVIQFICKIVLEAEKHKKDFGKELLEKVLKNQKLFCIPTDFNWNMKYNKSQGERVELGDMTPNENAADDYLEERAIEEVNVNKDNYNQLYDAERNIDYDVSDDEPIESEIPNRYKFNNYKDKKIIL